jgi:hypothetical protein
MAAALHFSKGILTRFVLLEANWHWLWSSETQWAVALYFRPGFGSGFAILDGNWRLIGTSRGELAADLYPRHGIGTGFVTYGSELAAALSSGGELALALSSGRAVAPCTVQGGTGDWLTKTWVWTPALAKFGVVQFWSKTMTPPSRSGSVPDCQKEWRLSYRSSFWTGGILYQPGSHTLPANVLFLFAHGPPL